MPRIRESENFLANMDAGVFHSHSVLRFPTFALFSKQWYLGKSYPSLKEVAVGLSPFVPQKGFNQFTISNIRCDGDKRGQGHGRKPVSGRTEKGDENKRPRTFDGKKSKSSDQEEIIALLRRIQLSISKGDSQGTERRSFHPRKDKPSAESILDVLRVSGKQVKGKASNESRENKALTKTRGVSRTQQEVAEQESNFRLTRLPSNFVRKSPIPSLSAPRGKVIELNDETSPANSAGDKHGQSERRLEKMKLSELKKLAKSRKIKGYSKLKKGELIDILGS